MTLQRRLLIACGVLSAGLMLADAVAAQAPVGGASLVPPAFAPPAANIHPAVARIVAPGNGSVSYGSGTLVYVDEQAGLVITNWHVVNEVTGTLSVHFPDGFYSLGTIQRVDRDWDLAAIVIRKPPVQPVPLANQSPRPGEMLTIAGYGSGNYRAASGPCTQYVAPGTTFPYEMVEVAVTARQGDSGGPIFNARGELAGVLFGEGNGRTSGSYCGRVRWFLSSVVPNERLDAANIAMQQPAVGQPTPNNASPEYFAVSQSTSGQAATRQTAPGQAALEPPRFEAVALAPTDPVKTQRPIETASQNPFASPNRAHPPVAFTPSMPATPSGELSLTWEDVAGESLAEQAKTVMAAIGILGTMLQVLRWLSSERATA